MDFIQSIIKIRQPTRRPKNKMLFFKIVLPSSMMKDILKKPAKK